MVDPHTWKCQTGSWKPPWSYTHTPCRTHIFLTHFPCVAKGVCSAPYLSISPSPFSCFIRLFCCSRTVTSRPHSCLYSLCRTVPDPKARVKHTSARAAGSLATWPIPRTPQGCQPKEFDKISSPDGDTTLINDPNYDDTSDFSKITRENTGLFGVSTMLEASVSHVSHGESKDSMHRETVARQREREREEREGSVISVAESMAKKS